MKKISIFFGLFIASFVFSGVVFAGTPNLSVYRENYSSNTVRITVTNADPYGTVNLYRRQSGSTLWTVITNFGQTDGSGYFNQVDNTGYGYADYYNNNVEYYVMVNGSQSQVASTNGGSTGCSYYYGCGTGSTNFNLSQTNINVNTYQTATVNINTGSYGTYYGNSYYVSQNTNSNIVSASISGTTINLYGLQTGSSTITICQTGGNSTCATLYVTVGNNNSGITFSNSNITLSRYQNQTINIYGNNYSSGNYYVSLNTNVNAVTATVSGNVLTVSGQNSGSSTITVCQYNNNVCGTVYVTVNYDNNNSGSLWFSPSSLSMVTGQTSSANIFGNYYGTNYYLSQNSNTYAVTATMSSNVLTLYAKNPGTATITVCQNSYSGCANLTVTVSGYANQSLSLSQQQVNMNLYQNASVNIYGSGPYNISRNTNPSAFTANILNGSTLNIYANSTGSGTITVCQSYSSTSCVDLQVTTFGNNNNGYNGLTINNSLSQPRVGQFYSSQLSATGGSWPYNFYLESGALPSGLTMSSSGLISGTPQVSQTSTFTVRVSDSFGRTGVGYFTLTTSGNVLGVSTYPSGQLISEFGTVYLSYKGVKIGFVSAAVFNSFGFKFANVLEVGNSGLMTSSYVVNNPFTSHPWGSWIKSGKTIYFVHENGLIPVPNMDVFTSNSGRLELVVPANRYDMVLPVLSVMEYSDSRLR